MIRSLPVAAPFTNPTRHHLTAPPQSTVNSWGIVNTFGVFRTYYNSPTSLLPHETNTMLSWVGSIQVFLMLVIGVVTGPLYDAGYFRAFVCTGSFLIVFGMMMTSLATEYLQIMLAQGICVELGSGCLFIPSVAIIPQWFSSMKVVATGIAASGSSIAGVIYPIVFYRLQPQIGFPWSTRVLWFPHASNPRHPSPQAPSGNCHICCSPPANSFSSLAPTSHSSTCQAMQQLSA
jgi:MFS family permease